MGHYWMEHPHFTLGKALVLKRDFLHPYYSLNGQKQIDLKILGCGLRLESLKMNFVKTLIADLACIAPKIGQRMADLAKKQLICGVLVQAAWEQAPVFSNYVSLLGETDKFGIPRVNLYLKKQELDRRTIVKTLTTFNDWLIKNGTGRLKLDRWVLENDHYPEDDIIAGHHHMGGTRMHSTPKYGVVDKNCKVFGSENLYMAGSSVFTTGGHNNPTLPIVELSLRLANYLSKK